MKPEAMTETDLVQIVVANLRDMQWDVYQEVDGPGGRCDIVATQGPIQWAIEVKKSFGFAVIEQAYNWKRWCHYTSVAVPTLRSNLGDQICRDYGIGVIRVYQSSKCDGDGFIDEARRPKLNRKALGLKLYEGQKTSVAGGNRGGHWTPFKGTVRDMIATVKRNPGIEYSQLLAEIDHHYSSLSSAKSCLRNFIGTSVIPDLRVEIVGRKLCIFLANEVINEVPERST